MTAVEIKISLPEGIARAAELLGLLTPESIETLLRAEIERRARAEDVEAIRQGMEEFDRGEGISARVALEELRQKHGISS